MDLYTGKTGLENLNRQNLYRDVNERMRHEPPLLNYRIPGAREEPYRSNYSYNMDQFRSTPDMFYVSLVKAYPLRSNDEKFEESFKVIHNYKHWINRFCVNIVPQCDMHNIDLISLLAELLNVKKSQVTLEMVFADRKEDYFWKFDLSQLTQYNPDAENGPFALRHFVMEIHEPLETRHVKSATVKKVKKEEDD